MKQDSTLDVAQAQTRLPRLLERDSFAISKRGKLMGVYLSRDRIEALVESMELLSHPLFHQALRKLESGKMKCYEAEALDAAMSR